MNNYNNPYMFPWFLGCYPYFENFTPVDKPPTLYSILNAKLNYENENKIKTYDFAENGRSFIFDFSYDLSNGISKSEFETLFIDRFLERRIGFETFNSFKIHLRAKLREILPYYNKLLDSLIDLKIIYDDKYTRSFNETVNTEAQELLDRDTSGRSVKDNDTTASGTAKTKFSDTPQGLLSNVENDRYMTDYTSSATAEQATLDETITNSGTDDYTKDNTSELIRSVQESSSKPFANRLENYQKYLDTKQSILTLIFNDLDELFFQLY